MDSDWGSHVTQPVAKNEPASLAVVSAVASLEAVDPIELPPLYEAIDPDALDAVFDAPRSDSCCGQVTFAYAGYRVELDTDEGVTVSTVQRDGRAPPVGSGTIERE